MMSVETPSRPVRADQGTHDVPLPPWPPRWRSLSSAFVDQARSRPNAPALADSTGAKLTYREVLLRSLALARVLSRSLGPEPYVGLMIPPTVAGAVANVAATLLGKIAVNLNYTASQAVVDSSVDQCGIKHVLTSRKAVERLKLKPKGDLIYLEDVAKRVTAADKVWALLLTRVVPVGALGTFLPGLRGNLLDRTATVIFTSGSTGEPKGVMLSHRNILSNVHQFDGHLHLRDDEVVLGILPFFHSFGFTVTIWTVLALGKSAVYHVNPLDSRIVGELCRDHRATLLAATPTFLRAYAQRCEPGQFATIRHLLLGAEKLKPELAAIVKEKLGVEPLEGYGCTELSPVAAVNVPEGVRTPDGRTVPGNKPGTVGRLLPGTAARTIDPDTGDALPEGAEGMVLIKGPQVMLGYLNRPEATAEVLEDGWYTTGDLGAVDEDGFLRITDRRSRFSKIGGEMVPHLGVESAILKASGAEEGSLAVTALPDPKRGERLVVVHTGMDLEPAEVCRRLAEGLPKLWIPGADDFVRVEALPILGTGKLDLVGLRRLAGRAEEGTTTSTGGDASTAPVV